MAAIAIGAGILPDQTTCCYGRPLELRSRGRIWDDDLWACPTCGCALRTALSDSVLRGLRRVIGMSTDNCTRGHS